MPAVTVVILIRPGTAADLSRSALSVAQQMSADWELRIVHGDEPGPRTAAATLAGSDPRIAGASDVDEALRSSTGDVVCILETGARLPVDYCTAVAAAMADPQTSCTVAARRIEHGPRFAQSQHVPPGPNPDPSQVAVRRRDAGRPLAQVLAMPGRRNLPDVVVATRFGEPKQLLTAVVEVSDASPPLSVKPQIAALAAAGIAVVVAVSGPVRAGSPILSRYLGAPSVVAGPSAAAARAAAVGRVATPLVVFLPAGWEVEPARLLAMADLLQARGAAAVIPVALDAGGSILGAGLVWADAGSVPQRLLAGHPIADMAGRCFEVPSPHSEGLTIRTADAASVDAPAPWWPVLLGLAGPVLCDGSTTIAIPRFTPPAAVGGRIDEARAAAVVTAAPADAVAASRRTLAELGWSVIGVQPGPAPDWRALLSRVRTEPVAARRWALKIGAPPGRRGDPWGDVFFADDLAQALSSLGNDVVVDRDGSAGRAGAYLDRVVLNLRGYQVLPRQPGAVNLLWIISHPDDVPTAELRAFDRVYAASASWQPGGVAVVPLLQATNPARFQPDAAQPDTGPDLLFVGNSRHQFRPIIADCRAAGLRPTVIGRDWEQFLPAEEIAAQSVPNSELPAAYRSAGIVLNDHWGDMVSHGFLNNRLFDAVACGARVVTDDVPGLVEVFGDAVAVYRTPADLALLCDPANRAAFGDDDMRRQRAAAMAQQHSFLARARVLMADAAQLEILPD